MAIRNWVMLAVISWACTAPTAARSSSVELEALLGSTAVLMINGQRQTLRVGQTLDGVTLVATQPATATLEIDGRTQTIGLSQRVGTQFHAPQEKVVTIARDAAMQYQTTAITTVAVCWCSSIPGPTRSPSVRPRPGP
jgi:hypothetical protein